MVADEHVRPQAPVATIDPCYSGLSVEEEVWCGCGDVDEFD